MQSFLHHRFLTEKIQGLLFFQSYPIDIADSCNTLLSGYWTFWSSGPEFILDTADFTKKPFHDEGETENSVMLQHHGFYSSYFCFISSVVNQKHSTPIYRWCHFQHISFLVLWSKFWEVEYKIHDAEVSSECLTYVCKLEFVGSVSSLSQWMWY